MRTVLVALVAVTSSGCYLSQAAFGQLELLTKARPLSRTYADRDAPDAVRRQLWEVPKIKRYAEKQGLSATRNYESYVALDRDAVVYVVSASQPLAFEAKRWSFPIVGSFTYLGWFDDEDAKRHGASLEAEGWDVYVRGASAYSTLGWFRDAVLSTMIVEGPGGLGDLVNVILHESVHATFHLPGQSTFNESLATFVGDQLTIEYLERRFGNGHPEVKEYLAGEARGASRVAKLHAAYTKLDALFKSGRSDDDKKAEKARIYSALEQDLGTKRTLNNATLIQFRTYQTGGDAFERLFERCARNWPRFWRAVRSLSSEDFDRPHADDFSTLFGGLDCSR